MLGPAGEGFDLVGVVLVDVVGDLDADAGHGDVSGHGTLPVQMKPVPPAAGVDADGSSPLSQETPEAAAPTPDAKHASHLDTVTAPEVVRGCRYGELVKTPLRLAAALAAVLLLTSCSSPAPAPDKEPAAAPSESAETVEAPVEVEPLPFNAGGLLGTNVTPNFEAGEPGEVSVVQIGALMKPGVGASLLFAFRNNTDAAISHVDWSATARSGGSIVATGSSQGTAPSQVQPGEVGLAYIFFENGETIPAEGVEYEFSVQTSPADTEFFNTAPMTVTESSISGDAIVGAAQNKTGANAEGPFGVSIYCFEGDNIVSQHMGFTEQDSLADGASGTFTVSLYGSTCPSYAIGVSGYFS